MSDAKIDAAAKVAGRRQSQQLQTRRAGKFLADRRFFMDIVVQDENDFQIRIVLRKDVALTVVDRFQPMRGQDDADPRQLIAMKRQDEPQPPPPVGSQRRMPSGAVPDAIDRRLGVRRHVATDSHERTMAKPQSRRQDTIPDTRDPFVPRRSDGE
jgi:hypothetical protein